MKSLFLCIISLGISIVSYGQELLLLKQVKLNRPVAVSTDRYSHLYIADDKGNLHKYDSTGNLLYEYTPQQIATISAIEAWPTMQVFVFYKDLQQYTFLNRFLTITNNSSNTFNSEQVGFASAATPASDETIWAFDNRDFSLKKYNPRLGNLSLQIPLELILSSSEYAINQMREYQNMLFISDTNSGILVFDNLGNYKKKLPFAKVNYFNFRDNELYFLSDSSIQFFNLYTLTTRSISLPKDTIYHYSVVLGSHIALISKDSLYIYQLNTN